MNVDYWSKASVIVASCSLVIYILGYIVSGIVEAVNYKRENYDLFIWNPEEGLLKKFAVIYEESTNNSEDYEAELLVSSMKMLYNFVAYSVDDIGTVGNGSKEIFRYNYLTPNEAILIRTMLPEGVPAAKMEWETEAFMKGQLYISYNGKIGNIAEAITYKPTIKTIILSIFRRGY